MNIQNLNQQELKQLQTLLNKMNPMHPTDVTHMFDPVNKMIDDIIENFDFNRVEKTMRYLNWTWGGFSGMPPDVFELKAQARDLLKGAADSRLNSFKHKHWELGVSNATGGLWATAFCNVNKTEITHLQLQFVLTDWDTKIQD